MNLGPLSMSERLSVLRKGPAEGLMEPDGEQAREVEPR